MSDFKLFNMKNGVNEIIPTVVSLEREIQSLVENNMEKFFGVRFLKSEYMITDGRMDSIGIDENNCPVIFEYKKTSNANVINQGLFYLDWLLDHRADFKLLVMDKLGAEAAERIDWSYPCVICIAKDFNRYDIHAVNQMQRNIKLVKYKKYGEDLIAFEHLKGPNTRSNISSAEASGRENGGKSHEEKLASVPARIKKLYEAVCEYIEEIDDEVVPNQLKYYLAYKKSKNVVCIEINNSYVTIDLKLDPDTVEYEAGFSRDVRNIGHLGTGNVQISIKNQEDFEKAKPFIERACLEG